MRRSLSISWVSILRLLGVVIILILIGQVTAHALANKKSIQVSQSNHKIRSTKITNHANTNSALKVKTATNKSSTFTNAASSLTLAKPKVAMVQKCNVQPVPQAPVPVSLNASSSGVNIQNDLNQYYLVYGNDGQQIEQQVLSCANIFINGNKFTAETVWSLNDIYSWSSVPGNASLCSVNKAAVGLHTRIIFPQWVNSTNAIAGTNSVWNAFISNLNVHEQGHITIFTQYANQLLNGLNNFPATDCSQIASALSAYTNSEIAAAKQADDAYEITTNYGTTQGATWSLFSSVWN